MTRHWILKNALVHVNETGISYELKYGRDENFPPVYRMKDIRAEYLFYWKLYVRYSRRIFLRKVYSLTFGHVTGVNADAMPLFMEKLRGSRRSNEEITAVSDEKVLYRPYQYIYWVVSRSSMDAVVDLDCADHGGRGDYNTERCPHVYKLFCEYLLQNTYNLYELLEKLRIDIRRLRQRGRRHMIILSAIEENMEDI